MERGPPEYASAFFTIYTIYLEYVFSNCLICDIYIIIIDGRGKLVKKDGSVFLGEWSRGVRKGFGKLTTSQGDVHTLSLPCCFYVLMY